MTERTRRNPPRLVPSLASGLAVLVLLVGLAGLSVAAQPPSPAEEPPSDPSSDDEGWPVKGPVGFGVWTFKPMVFGPYRAAEIHLGVTTDRPKEGWLKWLKKAWTPRLIKGDEIVEETRRRQQRFDYRMFDGERDLGLVRCRWTVHEVSRTVAQRRLSTLRDLFFTCFGEPSAKGDGGWFLTVTSEDFERIEGTLTLADRRLEVRGTTETAVTHELKVVSGYVIRKEGTPVADVRTLSPEIVWISPQVEGKQRQALAGAAAALLFTRFSEGVDGSDRARIR